MQTHQFRFRPSLIPTLATLILLPILINLGLWQAHKADHKQVLQDIYEKREKEPPIQIGVYAVDPDSVRFHRVVARGRYEAAYQILLDNQIQGGVAGYHVITPLRIEGSQIRILVNRGWIPLGSDRRVLPAIETPPAGVEVVGSAVVPSSQYLELAKPQNESNGWQPVWQNLDMKRYRSSVPFPVQPVMILLDAASSAGGYVREWPRPDLRIEMNRGYALQWYGMAVALVVIYLVTNIKNISKEDHDIAER